MWTQEDIETVRAVLVKGPIYLAIISLIEGNKALKPLTFRPVT